MTYEFSSDDDFIPSFLCLGIGVVITIFGV